MADWLRIGAIKVRMRKLSTILRENKLFWSFFWPNKGNRWSPSSSRRQKGLRGMAPRICLAAFQARRLPPAPGPTPVSQKPGRDRQRPGSLPKKSKSFRKVKSQSPEKSLYTEAGGQRYTLGTRQSPHLGITQLTLTDRVPPIAWSLITTPPAGFYRWLSCEWLLA